MVASVHSKLRMGAPDMTRRMLRAIDNPLVDVLGHCTGRMVMGSRKRPESQFAADRVFAACAANGVAVEINSRPERLDPPKRLLSQAVEAGCEFTIDTDAHAPGQLDWLRNGAERAVACGVPVERVRNSWSAERARCHPSVTACPRVAPTGGPAGGWRVSLRDRGGDRIRVRGRWVANGSGAVTHRPGSSVVVARLPAQLVGRGRVGSAA